MLTLRHLVVTLVAAILPLFWASHAALAQPYESYYLFLGHYPVAETNWSHNVQGVAHDDNYWYITNTEVIWKIPVSTDLRTVAFDSPGVRVKTLSEYQIQGDLIGYHHIGDPVVFRFEGTDYLIVPVENADATCTSGPPGAAAIFRCSDLSYVSHAAFPGQCNDAGWVAVDSQGVLVSSRQHIGAPPGSPISAQDGLYFFTFNWPLLHTSGIASMTFLRQQQVLNPSGGIVEMRTMQGGEFSPDGSLLYLVSGFHDDSNTVADQEGIHVVSTSTWQRVAHSTRGFGHFDFYYDPGAIAAGEPEGLTVWDLDNGRAPGIRGQLHVMRLDNDAFHDDIAFKHYTSIIRVDPASSCQSGTIACPFRTYAAAYNLAWPGAEIRLRTGIYLDRPVISKRIRISSEGGTVRIGG